MERIDHNILVETGHLGSNNAIVLTQEGVVLIDAPHKPTDALKWRRETESRGNVIYLVNTDHHIDHTMGNAFLGGTIIAHEETRSKLANDFPRPEFLRRLFGIIDPGGLELVSSYSPRLPSITTAGGLTLHLGDVTLELIHRKGHTPNSLMILIPEHGVLFTGDIVCEAGLPSLQEACLFPWLETLDEILEMDVRWIVPGHGRIGTRREVEVFRGQIEELVDRVREGMERGLSKEKLMEGIRFPDRIHVSTDRYQGYPEDLLEEFQRKTVAKIYDQLVDAA